MLREEGVRVNDNKIRSLDRLLASLVPRFITPNTITAIRLGSVPVIVILFLTNRQEWGVTLFFIAALTDAFDGAVARTRNQFSERGAKYDPVADKLLVLTGIFFIVLEYVPEWTVYTILGIEMAVAIGYLMFGARMKLKIKPNACGKWKMVALLTGMVSLGLYSLSELGPFGLTEMPALHDIGLFAIYASLLLGALSAVGYAYRLTAK